MNPLTGIAGPQMLTWQQGMPQGLMGNVLQQSQPQLPSLMNYQPGQWSQLAYQMAGSPRQGPYPSVPTPPMPAGVTNGTQSAGGSSIGGTALGLLGVLAKNPSLIKSLYNGVTGLLGGGADAGSLASIMAGGSPTLDSVGVGDVSVLPSVTNAVDAGVADAPAAISPLTSELPATATGAYGAGLMAGAPLTDVTGSLGAGLDAAAADASGAVSGSSGALGGGASADAAGAGLGGTIAAGSIAAAGLGLPIWAAFQHTVPPTQMLLNSMQGGTPGEQALGQSWQQYYNAHNTLPPAAIGNPALTVPTPRLPFRQLT